MAAKRYKVTINRSTTSKGINTYERIGQARGQAQRLANKYSRSYYIHRLTQGMRGFFWQFYETIRPNRKTGSKLRQSRLR